MSTTTTATVHSYENEFPADVLPRGFHRGTWTGYYVVLESGHHVPTDVAVQGSVKVILAVTDDEVSVALDLTARAEVAEESDPHAGADFDRRLDTMESAAARADRGSYSEEP